MTNDEARITKEIRNPNGEKPKLRIELRHSFVIGASSLVIHSSSGNQPVDAIYGFSTSFREAEFMQ